MVTMAGKRDYYEVLGVGRSASQQEIADSYRKLALKYHPDRNAGDEEAVQRFKEAAEAFEVLSDDQKRMRYDRFGHAGLEGAGGGAPHFSDVSEIFEAFGDLFGGGAFADVFGGRGGRRVRRGADVRCHVTLDLAEAATGVTRAIQFERHERCSACSGSGCQKGSQPETCSYCGGRGQVVQASGVFRIQTTCPACQGAGATINDPCGRCEGTGFTLERVKREVRIPAGVDNDTRLRLEGEGEPSPNGGPRGDCYVFLGVREHPLFRRDGQHLICQIPIGYAQATLGSRIEVPTLNGREELDIPAGTQPGEVFRLRGRGLPDPRRRGSKGDLLVQVMLEVPKKLTPRQEELLRELAEEENQNVTGHRKSFLEKLRDYFTSHEGDTKVEP